MLKKLNETEIYTSYSTEIRANNLAVSTVQMELIFKSFFEGLAEYLGITKRPDQTVAIKVTDYKKNFLLAAYCSFDGTGEEGKGSWEIDFTFNEADIPDGADVVDMREPETYHAMKKASNANGFYYKLDSDIMVINIAVANSIKNWLDANASETEAMTVSLDGVFEATVEVVDGVKQTGIVVKEEVKDIAKGDRILSEVEVR